MGLAFSINISPLRGFSDRLLRGASELPKEGEQGEWRLTLPASITTLRKSMEFEESCETLSLPNKEPI